MVIAAGRRPRGRQGRRALTPEALVYTTLEGPPGTGKSLIAASVARSAGWTFVPATVGSWFTSGDGALGGVARNVRGFVDEVLASEPAIGFLDEIDALPNRATISHRGRDWWLPVITLFLTEIDRVRKSGKKVLLIAATNYYSRLDEALIRPRQPVHRRVSVLPPQRDEEVIALLKYYLRGDLADADLTQLARIGRGATPAQVEGWLGQARGAARAPQGVRSSLKTSLSRWSQETIAHPVISRPLLCMKSATRSSPTASAMPWRASRFCSRACSVA